MAQKSANLKFWGVRGSIAAGNSKFGSHTSCVELDLGDGHSIFFDAGTGIREATFSNRNFKKITLCLSHFHWDHIQGLPFMTPLVSGSTPIEIFSGFPDVKQRLEVLFDERFHPVSMNAYEENLSIRQIHENESFNLNGLELSIAALNHPGKSYAFRLASEQTSFCYATDSDYDPLPEPARKLLHHADWGVLDSQFLVGDSLAKANYGHASFRQAIDTAAAVQLKNCILFHFDPYYSDEQLENLESQAVEYAGKNYAAQGLQVVMAKEGRSIPLVF